MYHAFIRGRRFLLTAGVVIGIAAMSQSGISARGKDQRDRYEGLNTEKYLGEVNVETRVNDTSVFTEGPAVDRAGNVYFTNVPVSKIMKWDPVAKELSVFRTGTNETNGLRFAANGDLVMCAGEPGALMKLDMKTGRETLVADQYMGKGLQSPNDLDIDSMGRIYFSSRGGKPDLEKHNVKSVYRVDPDGTVHQLLSEPDVHMPNGIVISPDEKTLYLIEADGGENRNRNILTFDFHKEDSLSNRRVLYDFYPGRSGDGMCIDEEGNLYVAAGLHKTRGSSETLDTLPGIHVISPQGKLLAFRETPEDTITNCTFGGDDLRTLYVTCGTYLLSIRTEIPGKQTYLPQN